MMTLGWPILKQGQIWSLLFLCEKCFSCRFPRNYGSLWGESWGSYRQINENMTYDNPRSRSFNDLWPRSLRFNILKLLFLKEMQGCLKPNFILNLHGMLGWKFVQMFLQKSPSSEPRGWLPWNLVYSIGYPSTCTIKFVQMMTLGWPWPFLWHGQICFLMLLHGWKLIHGESLYKI